MIPIKMHQMPGDIGKREKISMLEGRCLDRRRAKAYRKMIRSRERTVLRERTRNEIEKQLEEA